MITESLSNRVGIWVSFALFSVTIFVTPYWSYDPINVPKFFLLVAFAFAVLGIVANKAKQIFSINNLLVVIPPLLLLLIMTASLLFSGAPSTQQLFGTFGRNTGYLTYLSFIIIFLITSFFSNQKIIKPVIWSVLGAYGINAIYGFVQAIGKDPQNWVNPYAPVIGTLGNPDFASAFLGMGSIFVLSFVVGPKIQLKYRLMGVALIQLALFDILKSNAQQGIVVFALGVALITYFFIDSKIKSKIFTIGYFIFGFVATFFAIAGGLQKGPLSSILYKPSVTYRGDYWHAAIKMMFDRPFLGVGLDSYGDWYRTYRTETATLRRGPSVVSNAAHNVFLDIGATAGILALIAYLLFVVVGLKAAWSIYRRNREFNPFFVAVFVTWIAYLAQSAISINNIALGIWGWVLPGILVSMSHWQEMLPEISKTQKKKMLRKSSVNDFSGMTLIVGLTIGAVIGFIPFNADTNFVHNLKTGNADTLTKATERWPRDVARSFYVVKLFDQNKLSDKAEAIARKALKENPRFFDGWVFLYQQPNTTGNEKREIMDRLKSIDPYNSDLKKLG